MDNFGLYVILTRPAVGHVAAAEIAVRTVRQYRGDTEVIFNVFKDADYRIYRELLGQS